MRESKLFFLLFSTAAVVLGLTALEGGARFWVARRGDSLDLAEPLLRADARYGWRQREGLRTSFLRLPLATDELGLRNPGPPRRGAPLIAVLGPSSTFGWGVEEQKTYSRRLESLLAPGAPDDPPSVINAGEIGYSSWQGLRFYRDQIRPLRPRWIVIAYGVNDVDRHRFFFDGPASDAQALPPKVPGAALAVQSAVGRLRFPALARRALYSASRRWACGMVRIPESLPLRDSPSDFEANMGEMIDMARSDGTKVVLVTSPFSYPDTTEGSLSGSDCAAAYRRMGRLASEWRCAESAEALREATACEPRRLVHDISSYNRITRRLAAKRSVALVDAARLLDGGNGSLFVDPIHPNVEGHDIIAAGLAAAIKEADDR